MICYKQMDNGFKYIDIINSQAEAKIALQGAHIFHYKAKHQQPLLWLSQNALFEEGKAIRGGIPICFPWFGQNKIDTSLPQHGFARTQMWKVVEEEEIDEGTTHIQLQLLPNEACKLLWNYAFDLRLDITVGQALTVALKVTNMDNEAFEITAALHSYLAVSDIANVWVEGLKNKTYYDSLKAQESLQEGEVIIKSEVDRIYFNPAERIQLHDKERDIVLNQKGSSSLVVWNPWIEKSQNMTDMMKDGYKTMLCLETANALNDSRIVEPNQSHTLEVILN